MLFDEHEIYYLAPPLLEYKTLHLLRVSPTGMSSSGSTGGASGLTLPTEVNSDATTDVFRLRFAEIDDRQKAHEAVGRSVLLRTEELTEDELEATTDCADDFPEQGFEVYSDEGELLGVLSDRIETGANLVWVVVGTQGEELLLPVIEDLQISFDEEQRRITVHLLEGLRELNR